MTSLVIFAVNVRLLANFYEKVLEIAPTPWPGDSRKDIRLGNGGEELLIHSIPTRNAQSIYIKIPPVPRDESAIKPIFDVKSLPNSLEQVTLLGGIVTGRTFSLDGLTRHDIVDPEGNVVQLRSALL